MEFPTNADVLVGLSRADDAGVYRINAELALVQTVDFFTPVVDDPYWFGQIAAANALSDIYAMGGIPKTAMNLVCFPVKKMEMNILRAMIQGGLDKLTEAEVVLLGGHSVEDPELKYGMAVTGFIHPEKILTKNGLRPGDILILTKPLGTGIINTAIKAGLASQETTERVTRQMAALNRNAADVMAAFSIGACTDITGFGLLGHLAEMTAGINLGARLWARTIPILPEALEFAAMGLIPGGAYKNKEFRESMVSFSSSLSPLLPEVLFDPQTSGGLLMAVAPGQAEDLLQALKQNGVSGALIGEVVRNAQYPIIVE